MSSPNTGEQQWANEVCTLSIPATETTDFSERTFSAGHLRARLPVRVFLKTRQAEAINIATTDGFEQGIGVGLLKMAKHVVQIQCFYSQSLTFLVQNRLTPGNIFRLLLISEPAFTLLMARDVFK